MAGQGSGYHDFLGQGSYSSPIQPSAATTDEDEFGLFSQPSFQPRYTMENLDLNSQGDSGDHVESFTGLLHSDGVYGVPIAPRGGRTGRGGFQAPRPVLGGGRSGHGGGGLGRLMEIRGCASTSATNTSYPTDEYGDQNEAEEENSSASFDFGTFGPYVSQ
ncbi:hypothetical protein BS78_10G033800 [Paspalum vaginatum]|nr:hypothetical protein BS78_10G033800 [Paspalum vaginatum]